MTDSRCGKRKLADLFIPSGYYITGIYLLILMHPLFSSVEGNFCGGMKYACMNYFPCKKHWFKKKQKN